MRTRSTDYSIINKTVTIEEINKINKKLLFEISKLKNKLTIIERFKLINKIMSHTLKNVNIYIEFQKTYPLYDTTYRKLENFLKIFLLKKKIYKEEIKNLNPYENHECIVIYDSLMKKCEIGNRQIYDYFNHKYSVILFKTNRDIYRIILSYLF